MKEESQQPIRYHHEIGTIYPAYATAMGRVLLSELGDAEIDRFYPGESLPALTPVTLQTKTELKSRLEKIRNTGVSFENGGAVENLEGIASPVRDENGFLVPIKNVCEDHVKLSNGKVWGVPIGRKWGNVNIKLLASKMVECVKNPEGVKSMGESARYYVKQNYDWNKIAGKLAGEIE
jgi:glycosyltransferase involved in cell wall biosynthesis